MSFFFSLSVFLWGVGHGTLDQHKAPCNIHILGRNYTLDKWDQKIFYIPRNVIQVVIFKVHLKAIYEVWKFLPSHSHPGGK